MEDCTLCHDFGFRQIYQDARVKRISCDCPVGQRTKKKIEESICVSVIDTAVSLEEKYEKYLEKYIN